MKRSLIVFVLIALLVPQMVFAYKLHNYRWKSFPIVWYLDKKGYPIGNISLEQLQAALEQAFEAWENARYGGKCTAVRFKFGGYIDANGAKFDGKNVVSFATPEVYDALQGVSQTPGSLGKTVVVYDSQGYVKEADIVFPVTQNKVFSLNPNKNQYDLIGIAMHQIGHMIGINHSDVPQATMFGVWPPAGDTSWRTLSDDDKAAVVALYPANCQDNHGDQGSDAVESSDSLSYTGPGGSSTNSKEKWGCSVGFNGSAMGISGFLLIFVLLTILLAKRRYDA